MAYINTYLQLYAAIVMVIMLVGNLFGKYHMDSCRKLFYDLLGFDIVMLLAGSADNYVLIRLGDETGMLMHAVFAGISDFSYFMVLGLFTLYVDIYAKGGKGRADGIAYVGAAVALAYGIFWFVSDFWGIIYTQNAVALTFGPLYVAGQVGGYVVGLTAILILFRYRRIYTLGEKIGFSLFVFIPLLGSIFKYVFSDIILMPLLVTISIIIIQYFIQISRELVYSRQQTEMAKMQTDLLLSRMKPHFIYNVLNTIYALCDSSAEQAKKAIVAFSQYLRKSLVDIDSHELITFEDELNHVENYLMIEKLRFADQLEIEYDIREKDFLVPPLALQAVVENAVRHGIEKKPGGGRLLISTYRAEGAWHIMVKDTGAGFDAGPDIASITEGKEGRKHVGLYSASARLKELCKGSLTIKSRPGEGTEACIVIPEQKRNDDTGSRQ